MKKTMILEDEDVEVWRTLSETRDAIFRARTKELQPYGMTLGRSAILFAIEILGKRATPSEISRQLFRESHSVSKLLSDMEKEGIVKKQVDSKRKNVIRIKMTKKGRALHLKTIQLASIHSIMLRLSKNEKEELKKILIKLWDASLKELGIPARPIFPMWKYHRLKQEPVE